jgi:hypothetical protein
VRPDSTLPKAVDGGNPPTPTTSDGIRAGVTLSGALVFPRSSFTIDMLDVNNVGGLFQLRSPRLLTRTGDSRVQGERGTPAFS